MKKGEILEGIITKTEFPNKGTTEVEDRRFAIKGVIEGQKVKFAITKLRKGKAQGRLLEVIEKSSLEDTEPKCPHFGACGGCSYQTMSYENQLKVKAGHVKDLLDGVIQTPYEWEGILGSPLEWEYRNKMEFSFGDEYKDGPLALGMHKKNSMFDLVNVMECQIVSEDYRSILKETLAYFTEKGNHYYHKMNHKGSLRHLVVRRSITTGDLLINLVTTTQEEIDVNGYVEALLALPLEGKIVGILHTLNDGVGDVVKSDETKLLYGQDYFYEHILGLQFKISPFSFFQTNSLGAEVLYEKARSYVGETKDKVIFDLYSGTGTIAQMLAPVAKKVVGVEIIEEAVEAAKINARLNNLTNCEFIAGDVLKVIDDIEEKPDFIVLDPPREGIHPKAIQKIIDYSVDCMVYISCKPTSLVKDLEVLQERGYKVEKACCVDMFPMTAHV
ncbi:MAG: 23S rRNA (uracil(1939)-C(5))-methyltransferase RlmD, partial [Firmicutes bacterium]|nr:23S rRNA (uracil(1939)-C(5))-methyltransferase RlmD [Candidatus Scybalomonas excrementavium]